ncbi:MAG: hypothetical protein P8X50_13365 [Maritimibacter sp.]
MIAFIKRLWAAAPTATVLLALALGATVFFSVRAVVFSRHWQDPAYRELRIEGWMTPGFVAHSWHVPPEVVIDAVDAPRDPGHPITFDELAAEQGVTLNEVITRANEAIDAFREAHRPPEQAAPPPPASTPPAAPEAGK